MLLVQSKSAVPTTRPHGIEMQRGDVLYIPRGFPHMAETTGGNSSVHFTMTVMSQEFTCGPQLSVSRRLDLSVFPGMTPLRGCLCRWESFLVQLVQPGPAAVPPTPAQPLWSDDAHTAANLPEHWAALGCVPVLSS